MAFRIDDVLYPTALTSGAAGPEFSTDLTEVGSGFEVANQNWAASRMSFDLGSRIVGIADAETVVAFFRARKGRARGFRARDPMDSRSGSALANPAATDQVLGTGDGATMVFQLTKTYTQGGQSEVRKITRPVAGSVLIAGTAVAWSVDVTTGLVTFVSPPAPAAALTAGFRFDVPVRFDTDVLHLESLGGGNIQLPALPAIELRI